MLRWLVSLALVFTAGEAAADDRDVPLLITDGSAVHWTPLRITEVPTEVHIAACFLVSDTAVRCFVLHPDNTVEMREIAIAPKGVTT